MKKTVWLAIFLILGLSHSAALAKDNMNASATQKIGTTMSRGLINLSTLWMELPATALDERKKNPKIWYLTTLPASFTKMVFRFTSAAVDLGVYPFVAPFSDDIDPWTQAMGLPDYAYQPSEHEF